MPPGEVRPGVGNPRVSIVHYPPPQGGALPRSGPAALGGPRCLVCGAVGCGSALCCVMVTRDQSLRATLAALSDAALGSISSVLEEGIFFPGVHGEEWGGTHHLEFEVLLETQPGEWSAQVIQAPLPFDLNPTPLPAARLQTFHLRAPLEFRGVLEPARVFRALNVTLHPGMPLVASLHEASPVWAVPLPLLRHPLAVVHLFAGGFRGWTQALRTLARQHDFSVETEVHVDVDDEAISTSAHTDDGSVCRNPAFLRAWHVKPQSLSIQADVADPAILNAVSRFGTAVVTASPPCPPWSRARTGSSPAPGLDSEAGQAFLDLFLFLRRVSPLGVALECVDMLPRHPHFQILQALAVWAGFVFHFQQVHEHAGFAGAKRLRWLALLLRSDVAPTFSAPAVPPPIPRPVPWTDPSFNFDLPEPLAAQLYLTDQQRLVLSNPALLPASFQPSSGALLPPDEVLALRIADPAAPLRTLCAQYTNQHNLARGAVEERGIFAQIVMRHGIPSFLSPLLWLGLLGATEPLVLPVEVTPLFRLLGNSISVPHAALPLAIFFITVGWVPLTPMEAVDRVWDARLRPGQVYAQVVRNRLSFGGLADLLRFAVRDMHEVRTGDEHTGILLGYAWCPLLLGVTSAGRLRCHLVLDSASAVAVVFHANATVALLLIALRIPYAVIPHVMLINHAGAHLHTQPAAPLSGTSALIVPAQPTHPAGLPVPPPPLAISQDVVLRIVDPFNRVHEVSAPASATLWEIVWSLPLPDPLLARVRPYANQVAVGFDTTADLYAQATLRLRVFPLPGGGLGSQAEMTDIYSDEEVELAPPGLGHADPWLVSDPWSSDPPSRKLAKWEDLTLPLDHFFVYDDPSEDLPVPRVTPKQLLGPHLGGISFVTRASLAEVVRTTTAMPTVLLCPGAAPLNPPPLPSDAAVEGPIQLTLCDPHAKQEYQRVVFLVHLCPGIAYRPAASITTIVDVSEYVELVVERYGGRMGPGRSWWHLGCQGCLRGLLSADPH